MGIFPYQTPVEHERMNRSIKHFKDFCTLKGYKEFITYPYVPPLKGPFLAKDGKVYENGDDFYKGTGWYPGLVKDGVYYGWYEPAKLDGYVEPFEEECNFLKNKGYAVVRCLTEDYIENNNLEEAHYKLHGYVPRWEKDGKTYGHEQLLRAEGYVYSGEPPLPI
jgi:hypothetical protein